MPRYFIETGFVVNAVVTMRSMRTSMVRLIGSMTSCDVASIAMSFESLRSPLVPKSQSM